MMLIVYFINSLRQELAEILEKYLFTNPVVPNRRRSAVCCPVCTALVLSAQKAGEVSGDHRECAGNCMVAEGKSY